MSDEKMNQSNSDSENTTEEEFNSSQGSESSSGKSSSFGDKAKSVIGNTAKENLSDSQREMLDKAEKAKQTIQKVKNAKVAASTALSSIKTGIASFVTVFLNPVSLIVIGVILALIFALISIVAGTHIIGKNENAEGCIPDSSGNTGTKVETSADKMATANSLASSLMTTNYPFLGNKPFTLNQAAAIIGNWWVESQMIPSAVQPVVAPSNLSNAELKALGTVGGRAAGLTQWDGARRLGLAEFAESKGGDWKEANMQLDYLKKELDGWEGANLLSGGFNDQSKSVAELTDIFTTKFERAGKPHLEKRQQAAEDFLKQYSGDGGYTGSTGGSCLTATGGGVNTSDAVSLAISLSYETNAESRVSGGDSWGRSKAKQEYKDAKAKAMKEHGADGMKDLYASCDRFVATVTKLTMDPDIPWGSTIQQGEYLANSPKWQRYTTKSEAQPGDIWVTKTRGHIIMYIGDYKGKDSIAHASYLHRVAAIDPSSYLNENLVDTGGRPYYGYRFIG